MNSSSDDIDLRCSGVNTLFGNVDYDVGMVRTPCQAMLTNVGMV